MDSPERAERILRELVGSGIDRSDIGLMTRGPHSELAGADRGGAVITVEARDDAKAASARHILQKHGALEGRQ